MLEWLIPYFIKPFNIVININYNYTIKEEPFELIEKPDTPPNVVILDESQELIMDG